MRCSKTPLEVTSGTGFTPSATQTKCTPQKELQYQCCSPPVSQWYWKPKVPSAGKSVKPLFSVCEPNQIRLEFSLISFALVSTGPEEISLDPLESSLPSPSCSWFYAVFQKTKQLLSSASHVFAGLLSWEFALYTGF